jgi:hypothetical protein
MIMSDEYVNWKGGYQPKKPDNMVIDPETGLPPLPSGGSGEDKHNSQSPKKWYELHPLYKEFSEERNKNEESEFTDYLISVRKQSEEHFALSNQLAWNEVHNRSCKSITGEKYEPYKDFTPDTVDYTKQYKSTAYDMYEDAPGFCRK